MRLIRVMCSGRVDLDFILRAFANGQDGVFIGGCRLDECNYITHGNYDALANTYLCKRMLAHIGLNPDRLRIEFMSGADGNLLAEKSDDFARCVRAMGPLGHGEGIEKGRLNLKLRAARKLVPYLRLVERERLRAPAKTKQAYSEFFGSSEIIGLFDELFVDKWTIGQILLLLEEKPLSTSDISAKLGLNPSDVSRHMNSASRHGWVRYDTTRNCYASA
jgi:coenzyme F420-reducing hydrogenase delta subunit